MKMDREGINVEKLKRESERSREIGERKWIRQRSANIFAELYEGCVHVNV